MIKIKTFAIVLGLASVGLLSLAFISASTLNIVGFEAESGATADIIQDDPSASGDSSIQFAPTNGGENTITVRARGKTEHEQIELRINDTAHSTWTLSATLEDYTYEHNLSLTASDVKVAYINNTEASEYGEAAAVIDYIKIGSSTYQSESSDTYSTGTWAQDSGCDPGYKQSEELNCGGYFHYGQGGNETAGELRVSMVGGEWRIVDSDQNPYLLNGVSVRRNHSRANDRFASREELAAIRDNGFDSIRVVIEWNLLEPSPGQWHAPSLEHLDQVVADAGELGLYVMLDPIHHVGGSYIPQWVWDNLNTNDKNRSVEAVGQYSHDYLRMITNRYSGNDHVVAIDLANELREAGAGSRDEKTTRLLQAYHDMIKTVREIDSDIILIAQPFYGNVEISADQLARLSQPTPADPQPDPAHFTNIVWSLHDYYSGNKSGPDDDGYSGGGSLPWGQRSADGMLMMNSWNTTSCYPAGRDVNNCPDDPDRRANVLRPSMAKNVKVHYDAAQANGMPLLIGEYGLPHPGRRAETQGVGLGWGGGDRYLSDKKTIYDDLGVSRFVWAFSENIDETYGLYKGGGEWHPWTPSVVD